jgi:hypothetical protein
MVAVWIMDEHPILPVGLRKQMLTVKGQTVAKMIDDANAIMPSINLTYQDDSELEWGVGQNRNTDTCETLKPVFCWPSAGMCFTHIQVISMDLEPLISN